MSVQNAASWGYFNCSTNEWNKPELQSVGFPIHFLPEVKNSGEYAGVLAKKWHSIPKGTPIGEVSHNTHHLSLCQDIINSSYAQT